MSSGARRPLWRNMSAFGEFMEFSIEKYISKLKIYCLC